MEAITIYPKNKKQKAVFTHMAKALNLEVKVSGESHYSPEFVDEIKQGEKDLQEGKGVNITLEYLGSLCK